MYCQGKGSRHLGRPFRMHTFHPSSCKATWQHTDELQKQLIGGWGEVSLQAQPGEPFACIRTLLVMLNQDPAHFAFPFAFRAQELSFPLQD